MSYLDDLLSKYTSGNVDTTQTPAQSGIVSPYVEQPKQTYNAGSNLTTLLQKFSPQKVVVPQTPAIQPAKIQNPTPTPYENTTTGIAVNTIKGLPKATIETAKKIADSFFPSTAEFIKTTGGIFGEGLAYALDKNVRDQYKAGNTDILPTVTKTSQADLFKKTLATGIEQAVYKVIPASAKLGVLQRAGIGGLQGVGFALADGLAHGKSFDEIKKDAATNSVLFTAMEILFPYLAPLLKTELKNIPENVRNEIKNAGNKFKTLNAAEGQRGSVLLGGENEAKKYGDQTVKIISDQGLPVTNGAEKHFFNSPEVQTFAKSVESRIPNPAYIKNASVEELAQIRDEMVKLRNEIRDTELPRLFDEKAIGSEKQLGAAQKIEQLALERLKRQIDTSINNAEEYASLRLFKDHNIPEGGYPTNAKEILANAEKKAAPLGLSDTVPPRTKIYRAGQKGNYFSTSPEYPTQGGFSGPVREASIPSNLKILDATKDYNEFNKLATPEELKKLSKATDKESNIIKQEILNRNGYDGVKFMDEGSKTGKVYESLFLKDSVSPDFTKGTVESVENAVNRAKAGESFGPRNPGIEHKPKVSNMPKPREVRTIPKLNQGEVDKLPQDLQERLIQHEIQRENLATNPLKDFKKNVATRGEFAGQLPEVTGKKNASNFGKSGDKMIEKTLGSSDSYATANDTEAVRARMDKYLAEQKAHKDNELELAKEIKAFKEAHKKDILSKKDEAIMNRFLNKSQSEADRVAAKIKRIESHKAKIEAEEEKRQKKIRNINAAYESVSSKPDIKGIFPKIKEVHKSLLRTIRNATKPFKNLDKEVQDAYLTRKTDLLLGHENAQAEFKKLADISADDGWKAINEYEAGNRTPTIERMKKVFNDLHARAQKMTHGYIPYRENYIPHVYQETPEEIHKAINEFLVKEKKMTQAEAEAYQNGKPLGDDQVARLKLSRFFEQHRTIDTYKLAEKYGLTPKYTHPAQLAAFYREELEKTVANAKFRDTLSEQGKILVDQAAPRGWQYINVPGFEGMKAPRPLQKALEGLFTPGSKFWKYLATFNRRATDVALSGGVPYTTSNYFATGQAVKEITGGNLKAVKALVRANSDKASKEWFDGKIPTIRRMAKQGIDVTSRQGNWETAFKNNVKNGTWTQIVGKKFDKAFNEKTFNSFIPQMHIQMFDDVFTKAVKDGLPESEAEKIAGDVVKKSFGLIEEWGRSKTTKDVISTFLFAPHYRESIANTLWNTAQSVTTQIKNPAFRRNRKLLAGMAIAYGIYNAVNYELNGHPTWKNPKGREFALRIPINKGKEAIYIEFMPGFLALPRNIGQAAIALGKGDTNTFGQKIGTAFSIPIKTATEIISNQDYFGRPIWKESDSTALKIAKMAEHAGVAINHPYIREAAKYFGLDFSNKFPFVKGGPKAERPPIWQSISSAIELPLKFGSTSKERTNQYYDENAAQTVKRAKENKKYMSVFENIQSLVDAGKTAEAQKMYDALSDEEKVILKRINTSQKAAATKKRQAELYDTLLSIRELNGKGKTAEAQALYDALSDKDKKLLIGLNKTHPAK